MNLFKKKVYVPVSKNVSGNDDAPAIPDGAWLKCLCCGRSIYNKAIGQLKLCPHCGGCFRLTSAERIFATVDEGSFLEMDESLRSKNPMAYPGYEKKIMDLQKVTGLNDAVVTGVCAIGGYNTVLAVMDSGFIMGSMGSVVGEKITRAFEYATQESMPIIIFTASGGARMQEGIISLMQMAKVSSAAARHSQRGLLYITVLTDPTTGGVTASFAMQGDIILSEPGALIGFAGRRVIEQTIKQTLPGDFQKAEFLLEHGFIDRIVPREAMQETLGVILRAHCPKN